MSHAMGRAPADAPAHKAPGALDGIRRQVERQAGALRAWLRGIFPPITQRPLAILRKRLLLTSFLATTLALAIVSLAVYAFEAHLEMAQIDAQLMSEAKGKLSPALLTSVDTGDVGEAPYDAQSSNVFSVVIAAPGRIVQNDDKVQSYSLPDWAAVRPVLSGAQPSTLVNITQGGVEFRLYTAPIVSGGQVLGAVQSGISLVAYYQHLDDLARALALFDTLILVFVFVSSVYMTERALKPAVDAFERQRLFAAGASHELRTPLALIRSLAELISDHRCAPEGDIALWGVEGNAAEGGESQADVTRDANDIIHEVDYMTRLVSRLLLLARDEHDRRALNWTTVDLRQVVADVVSKMQPVATAHGVSLRLDESLTGQSRALTNGDPDRLRELTVILLENAVRYTPAGGRVNVEVAVTRWSAHPGERSGRVALTVRDTGIGIAPEDQPHIFEPFYRSNSSAMRLGRQGDTGEAEDLGGAGLGLGLAHWIVEAHDGRIRLSSALGKGATFTVELPFASTVRLPRSTNPDALYNQPTTLRDSATR